METLELTPGEFLTESRDGIILDVRTPHEYSAGHIPGAVNFPLFTNEERAVVGTLYVSAGKDEAIEKGLEFVGPKMASFVREAKRIAEGNTLYIHCWRGGMRSGSMAWLLQTAGLNVRLLKGGYKAYRQSFPLLLESKDWQLIVLGGSTGCGKTQILHSLADQGEQVLRLEGLARHKGSAFGALGEEPQPTTEQFANDLHQAFRGFDPSRPVWCEGESESIGKVFIPKELFARMLASPLILLELPSELRVCHILKEYGTFPADQLIASFRKIERRLGGAATAEAVCAVKSGDLPKAISIALQYYDKAYAHSFYDMWHVACTFRALTDDPEANAQAILELIKQNKIVNK